MNNVTVMEHPLIKHKITILRKNKRDIKNFASLWKKFLCLWPMRQPVTFRLKIEIETPISKQPRRLYQAKSFVLFLFYAPVWAWLTVSESLYPTPKSATSAYIATMIPWSRWNITASCHRMLTSGWLLYLTQCLQPAVPFPPQSAWQKYGAKHIKLMSIVGTQQGIDFVLKTTPMLKYISESSMKN